MTTDDLRTRAREAAEAEWPVDGFWMSAALRQGFIAGYLAHAAQQPSREELAEFLADLAAHDREVKAEALREAVFEMRRLRQGHWNLPDPRDPDVAYSVDRWLEVRADRIESEARP